MEPYHFRYGNTIEILTEPTANGASMEPYHFRYGNTPWDWQAGYTEIPASMEPYHFRYGNKLNGNAIEVVADGLQWSHTISGMETD